MLAIISATATENGPKCHPVTSTEIVVNVSKTTSTIACDE